MPSKVVLNHDFFKVMKQDFWMSILLDVGIGLEINVLTSNILLGDQMLDEMGRQVSFTF